MTTYIITTHPGLPGVALSKQGQWGGVRYDSVEAAEQAAADDARGPHQVQHERARR